MSHIQEGVQELMDWTRKHAEFRPRVLGAVAIVLQEMGKDESATEEDRAMTIEASESIVELAIASGKVMDAVPISPEKSGESTDDACAGCIEATTLIDFYQETVNRLVDALKRWMPNLKTETPCEVPYFSATMVNGEQVFTLTPCHTCRICQSVNAIGKAGPAYDEVLE